MAARLLGSYLVQGLIILAACYAVYLPFAPSAPLRPLALAALLALGAGLGTVAGLALPRRPLPPERADLARWVTQMGALAGLRIRRVSVAEVALLRPQPLRTALGEVVFTADELASGETWTLLATAGRQLALVLVPSRLHPWRLLGLGAAAGAALAIHHRLGESLLGALAAIAIIVVAMGLLAWRRLEHAEAWGKQVEERGKLLLADMRQHHPEAFHELAVKQGLAPM